MDFVAIYMLDADDHEEQAARARRSAGGVTNLGQGSLRLFSTLVALWFIYWSFAFVLVSASKTSTALPALNQLPAVAIVGLAIVAVLGLWWTALGFRSG